MSLKKCKKVAKPLPYDTVLIRLPNICFCFMLWKCIIVLNEPVFRLCSTGVPHSKLASSELSERHRALEKCNEWVYKRVCKLL